MTNQRAGTRHEACSVVPEVQVMRMEINGVSTESCGCAQLVGTRTCMKNLPSRQCGVVGMMTPAVLETLVAIQNGKLQKK